MVASPSNCDGVFQTVSPVAVKDAPVVAPEIEAGELVDALAGIASDRGGDGAIDDTGTAAGAAANRYAKRRGDVSG